MFFLSFAALALVAVAVPKGADITEDYTFAMYNVEFKKGYRVGTAAWKEAEATFLKYRTEAIAHNRAGHSWMKAINRFSDWTAADLKSLGGFRHIPRKVSDSVFPGTIFNGTAGFVAPANIDWRNKNVLTPIKNQMQCGGCWSFAATETIESSAAVESKMRPQVLAVEQILRCTPNPNQCGGTGGCNGATAELAYAYAATVAGITKESEYPYVSGGGDTGDCNWTPAQYPPVTKVSSYHMNAPNSRAATVELLTKGPISIGVDASMWSSYGGGVFDVCNQQSTLTLDHAVQLVGMSTKNDGSVEWIVRNSWGADWGEEGFIRLADTNACVTDPAPGDGSGCANGPSQVTVCGPCGLFYEVSMPVAMPIS